MYRVGEAFGLCLATHNALGRGKPEHSGPDGAGTNASSAN